MSGHPAQWRRDESIGLIDCTAATLLSEQAQRFPDRLAIIGTDARQHPWRLTYRDVVVHSRKIATALLRDTEPGDHIAVLAPNVVEWPLIEYAVGLAGRTLVALNPHAGIDELRYTLRHSDTAMLIYAPSIHGRDLSDVVRRVVAQCPTVRRVYALDVVWSWSEGEIHDEHDWPTVDPSGPAMLQYTSGTTGPQKGVLLSHRAVVNVARIAMQTCGVQPGSVCLSPFPQFHTAGCVTSTLGALGVGGTLVIMERWDASEALALIRREGVTTALLVPAMLDDLVQAARRASGSYSVPTILAGASTVPAELIRTAQDVFGGSVFNVYGQTEVSAPLTATRRGDSADDIANTIGRPLPQVECRIADPRTGRTVDVGVIGEICARGYQQMLGYYRDPDATAGTVDADGWVHTGDLGTMNERGYLTITGRLKELIIRGGENISPTEVSQCLLDHDSVQNVAVVGLPDDRLGELVAAVVVAGDGADQRALAAKLHDHCAARLARYKIPQQWFFTDELALTASGKVRSLVIRQMILDGVISSPQKGRM
ncbi:o-succinylbenzoate--CoA ligase [Mycolicibacterium rhodesiae JS60]|nr:o-succinylbenzoate--CoA ligase [Mycolicibacterium rhodesiae JS60]